MTSSVPRSRHRTITLPLLAVAGASLLFAACGSSAKSSSSTSGGTPASGSATTRGAAGASDASVTVKVANVAKLGDVLVNGDGRTLYVIDSEQGGKVSCTASGGCTTYWPPAVLPAGMAQGIAGSGAKASLLGTVTSPSGDVRLTYAGWPLYTYTGDSGPGQATGQGVKDSFGTWWVLGPSGTPITTPAPSSPASTSVVTSPPATATSSPSPPATSAVSKSAPATSPPVTSPPATSPPATSPPATSPPPTSPPTTTPSSGGAGF